MKPVNKRSRSENRKAYEQETEAISISIDATLDLAAAKEDLTNEISQETSQTKENSIHLKDLNKKRIEQVKEVDRETKSSNKYNNSLDKVNDKRDKLDVTISNSLTALREFTRKVQSETDLTNEMNRERRKLIKNYDRLNNNIGTKKGAGSLTDSTESGGTKSFDYASMHKEFLSKLSLTIENSISKGMGGSKGGSKGVGKDTGGSGKNFKREATEYVDTKYGTRSALNDYSKPIKSLFSLGADVGKTAFSELINDKNAPTFTQRRQERAEKEKEKSKIKRQKEIDRVQKRLENNKPASRMWDFIPGQSKMNEDDGKKSPKDKPTDTKPLEDALNNNTEALKDSSGGILSSLVPSILGAASLVVGASLSLPSMLSAIFVKFSGALMSAISKLIGVVEFWKDTSDALSDVSTPDLETDVDVEPGEDSDEKKGNKKKRNKRKNRKGKGKSGKFQQVAIDTPETPTAKTSPSPSPSKDVDSGKFSKLKKPAGKVGKKVAGKIAGSTAAGVAARIAPFIFGGPVGVALGVASGLYTAYELYEEYGDEMESAVSNYLFGDQSQTNSTVQSGESSPTHSQLEQAQSGVAAQQARAEDIKSQNMQQAMTSAVMVSNSQVSNVSNSYGSPFAFNNTNYQSSIDGGTMVIR